MQIHKLLLILFCCSITMSVQGADVALVPCAGAGAPAGGDGAGSASGGAGVGCIATVEAAREIQRVWLGHHVRAQQARAIEAALEHLSGTEALKLTDAIETLGKRCKASHFYEGIFGLRDIALACRGQESIVTQCFDKIKAQAETPGALSIAIDSWGSIAAALPHNEALVRGCLESINKHAEINIEHAIIAWKHIAVACATNEAVVLECVAKINEYSLRAPAYPLGAWNDIVQACVDNETVAHKCLDGLAVYAARYHHDAIGLWGNIAAACVSSEAVVKRCLENISNYALVLPYAGIGALVRVMQARPSDGAIVHRCLDGIATYTAMDHPTGIRALREAANAYRDKKVIINECLDLMDRHALMAPHDAIDSWAQIGAACPHYEAIVHRCLDSIDAFLEPMGHYTAPPAWKKIGVACVEHSSIFKRCFDGCLRYDSHYQNSHLDVLVRKHLEHRVAALPTDRIFLMKQLLYRAQKNKREPAGGVKEAGDDRYHERANALVQLFMNESVSRLSQTKRSNGELELPYEIVGKGALPGREAFKFLAHPLCHGTGNDDAADNCPICVYAQAHGIGDAPTPAA